MILSIDKELDALWRIHETLSTGDQADMIERLVEIAVEYAFLTGLAEPTRTAWARGTGEGNHSVLDVEAEAAKILGTVREFQRFGDGPEFTEHAFKTLLKHVHYDGLKVSERCQKRN